MACSVWEALSAIGTLAAVAVALWFSVQSMRVSGRAEKDRAELAAAKMLSPLKNLLQKSDRIFYWFAFRTPCFAVSTGDVAAQIKSLGRIAQEVSMEDLYPLLQLQDHAAKRASRALGLIGTLVNSAHPLLSSGDWGLFSEEDRAESYREWSNMISEIRDHLIISVRICESAAALGAPRPSSSKMHEEQPAC